MCIDSGMGAFQRSFDATQVTRGNGIFLYVDLHVQNYETSYAKCIMLLHVLAMIAYEELFLKTHVFP